MAEHRRLWILVGAMLLAHLALAAALPLVEDEAYYRLWSTAWAAGYYDHPPMVAWWIGAGRALLGDTTLGVRLAFLLGAGGITLLSWRIALVWSRDLRTAFLAALFTTAALPFSLGGIAATPDIPSALFWSAATWALSERLTGGRPRWWLAVGLFAGLGVLSKFTDLFLGVGLVLWLLLTRRGRAELGTVWPWLGGLVALAVLAPFLWWNMQHGWVGFERQFGRLDAPPRFSLVRLAAFWAALAMLLTPVLAWRVLRAVGAPRVPAVLWWLVGPLTAYLAWHAFRVDAGGQWMMPAMPTLAVIAALGMGGAGGWRLVAPVGYGIALVVLVLGLWPARPLVGLHGPFGQMRGWPAVRAALLERARQTGAAWIVTDAYGPTGQLAWYLDRDLPVWSAVERKRYLFRPPFPTELCTRPALLVTRRDLDEVRPLFRRLTPLPPVERRSGDTLLRRLNVALVEGPTEAADALDCAPRPG